MNKEGQKQEPVGGMKWEDVQILAKKHAEQIIEMGWRDNPDKDDIIADFISGYASAPPPAPEGEENQMRSADYWFEKSLHIPVAKKWQMFGHADIVKELIKEMMEYYATPPPSPVGIDVEDMVTVGEIDETNFKYPTYEQAGGDKKWDDMSDLEKANYDNCKYLNALAVYKTTVKRLRKEIEILKSGYSASLPQSSTEEEKELAELRCWKESAMKVMADMQEIGKELGVKLGESIHDKILPAIINYKKLLTGSPPPDVEALAHSMADKWVFETNGHRWSNNDSTAGDNFDSYENGFKAGYASLPSSSVTGEEGWKEEFIEWLNNNMKLFNGSLPKSSIIADHVERYIVKSIPVTGEWQLCPKCNGEGFLQIGKAIPDGRIDFTCEVCNGKKILAKPGESEAIGMIKWIRENYEPEFGDGRHWEDILDEAETPISDKELYNLYKQSKK